MKNKLGKWIITSSQEWDTYLFRRMETLIWRRIEEGQEKWYDHGKPEDGIQNYNVNKEKKFRDPREQSELH